MSIIIQYKKNAAHNGQHFFILINYWLVDWLDDMPNTVSLVISRKVALTSSDGARSPAKSANGHGH